MHDIRKKYPNRAPDEMCFSCNNVSHLHVQLKLIQYKPP